VANFKPLNLLDLSFVLMETRQTPMHVAGLQTFRLPEGAPRDFPRQFYEYLRSFPVTAAPFNYRLRRFGGAALVPSFEVLDRIDLDYHLRHSALPYPGGERELGVLVSRLHSNAMDMDRPLWEVHLIEGLQGDRFALYAKLHHSLTDGVSGVGLLNYATEAGDSRIPPIWAAERPRRSRSASAPTGPLQMLPGVLKDQAQALPSLLQGLLGSAKAAIGLKADPDFTSLAETPRTIFNADVTPQRRVATQATSLARMKAIGAAAGGSLNDVLLAACSGALRRYLIEIGELPSASLITSVPVALAREEGQAGGNAISFANVRLATDVEDVRERFEVIRRSSIAGREYLKQMNRTALIDYTVLISSPQMFTRVPGIGARVPPIYNVIISNVPGPREKLYFGGAEMEAYYPISALAHGQALNITVMSYAGGMYFGFTACPDRVPRVQRLAVYTGEALDELEAVFVAPARHATSPKARRGAAAKRSKSVARKHVRTVAERAQAAAPPAAGRRRKRALRD
jgi:WS/DGAT/MGAT family acyltransferase